MRTTPKEWDGPRGRLRLCRLSRKRPQRSGFTLLEVMLATVISVLLMAALYVAMDLQIRLAREGREIVERSALERAVLVRLTRDLTACLSPQGTTPSNSSSSSSSGGGSVAGAATTPATGTGTAGMGSTPGATSSSSTTASGTPGPSLNFGVQGDASSLVVLVSRPLPMSAAAAFLNGDPGAQMTGQTPTGDLRRITYWLATDGGLARSESFQVTGDPSEQMAATDEASAVFAPEVRSLQFRYFDGTNWQDNWDGTQPGSDGVTPMGPPRAIEVTIGIGKADDPNAPVTTHRHVIAIPAANGAASTDSNTTTGADTTTGSTP